jgi:hypothetical protein
MTVYRKVQEHIAIVVGALGKTISAMITGKESFNRKAALADLSDASRYLVGTQYSLSLMRRKTIQSQITDSFMTKIIATSDLYPNLCGADLSNEVLNAKAHSKVGQEPTSSSVTKGFNRQATRTTAKPYQPSHTSDSILLTPDIRSQAPGATRPRAFGTDHLAVIGSRSNPYSNYQLTSGELRREAPKLHYQIEISP